MVGKISFFFTFYSCRYVTLLWSCQLVLTYFVCSCHQFSFVLVLQLFLQNTFANSSFKSAKSSFCEITINSILYWSWKSFWIFIEPRDWNSEKVNMNLEQQPIILDSFKTFRLKRSFDWNAFYVFWSKDRNQNKISLFE